MANTSVTTQIHQTFDIHSHFTAQVTFQFKLGNLTTYFIQIIFAQLIDLYVTFQTGRIAYTLRTGISNPKDIGFII
jgi:hypothetical protein